MATASSYGGRRHAVSFDRVERGDSVFGDHAFELSQEVDLTSEGLQTVTWVYDSQYDAVYWSYPIEEFFGFTPGTRGFSVHRGSLMGTTEGIRSAEAGGPREPSLARLGFGNVTEVGESILAPILAAIRAGTPCAEFDLHMVVTCPDGTDHLVVVRASPLAVPSGRPGDTTGRMQHFYTGVVIDVTAQQKFEGELGDLVERYRLLTEVSPDVVCVHQNGRLVYGNRAAVKLMFSGAEDKDYAQAFAEHYGMPVTDIVHPNDVPDMAGRLAQLTEDGQFFEHGEARIMSFDGSITVMEVTSVRTSWNGEPAYQVIARDISERRAAEAANRYRASLVAHVSDAIIGIDADGRIESWNEAAQAIYGWSEDEVTGLSIGAVVTANRTDSAAVLERGQRTHHRKDGSEVDVLVSIDPLIDDDTQPSGWVVVCTELTDARQAEAGRRAAEERYEAVVASLSEGIVLFDESGNICALNEAATRILGDRLESGSGHQIFTGSSIAIDADGQPLSAPVQLSAGRSVVVTCSVGVSFVMRGRQTAQDILQQADVAMFQAKNKGRSRVEVFDESLRAKSVARLEIYDDLRHSIDHDELAVHYQPIASVADDRIVAMEALVRWHHPSRGLLGPMEFIPFAEETDLIFSLGRWVLREACQTMAKWRRDLPGAENAYVTVNLSPHQLNDADLLDTIAAALADSGLPPEALVLEVTESMLMNETSTTIATLGGIHGMGVGLAIDDFGTGTSSLARLKNLPVKILKIDKSFVDGLGILETDEAIVAAIVQLSKALDLVVLAEGVETPIQLQRVAELGCDLYQGYLMSRPTRADRVDFKKRAATSPQSDTE